MPRLGIIGEFFGKYMAGRPGVDNIGPLLGYGLRRVNCVASDR